MPESELRDKNISIQNNKVVNSRVMNRIKLGPPNLSLDTFHSAKLATGHWEGDCDGQEIMADAEEEREDEGTKGVQASLRSALSWGLDSGC